MNRPKRLLIVGDSFSAQWDSSLTYPAWYEILEDYFIVTNIAQAGVGEFKILQQLKSINLDEFDFIVGNHTSHSRIHSLNSIHTSKLHRNSDLIYNDSKHLPYANWVFKFVYDDNYYKYVYSKIREEIDLILKDKEYFMFDPFYSNYKSNLSLVGKWKFDSKNKNHLNKNQHRILAEKILYYFND